MRCRCRSSGHLAGLAGHDAIITCQGGDYTKQVLPQLREQGWTGFWIDAASAKRMDDDSVIVLDPLNRDLIDQAHGLGEPDEPREDQAEEQERYRDLSEDVSVQSAHPVPCSLAGLGLRGRLVKPSRLA